MFFRTALGLKMIPCAANAAYFARVLQCRHDEADGVGDGVGDGGAAAARPPARTPARPRTLRGIRAARAVLGVTLLSGSPHTQPCVFQTQVETEQFWHAPLCQPRGHAGVHAPARRCNVAGRGGGSRCRRHIWLSATLDVVVAAVVDRFGHNRRTHARAAGRPCSQRRRCAADPRRHASAGVAAGTATRRPPPATACGSQAERTQVPRARLRVRLDTRVRARVSHHRVWTVRGLAPAAGGVPRGIGVRTGAPHPAAAGDPACAAAATCRGLGARRRGLAGHRSPAARHAARRGAPPRARVLAHVGETAVKPRVTSHGREFYSVCPATGQPAPIAHDGVRRPTTSTSLWMP